MTEPAGQDLWSPVTYSNFKPPILRRRGRFVERMARIAKENELAFDIPPHAER